MTRLFDSQEENRQADRTRRARDESRRRASEAEEALRELKETDEASAKLRETLSQTQSVTPIRYEEYRPRGSRWMIEHSRVGDDYVFQMHPLRPPVLALERVLKLAITSMDVIFPRSLKIQYTPPSQQYQMKFYTIKVNGLAGLPGWRGAVDRALRSLSALNAWPKRVVG